MWWLGIPASRHRRATVPSNLLCPIGMHEYQHVGVDSLRAADRMHFLVD